MEADLYFWQALNYMKMKNLILPFFLLLFTLSARSQGGQVYMSFEDYMHHKAIAADASCFKVYVYEITGSVASVTLKSVGVWKDVDVWGFSWGGKLYRFIRLKGPHTLEVADSGRFILYRFSNPPHDIFYISKRLNSDVYRVNIHDPERLAKEDPDYKALADFVANSDRKKTIDELIKEYNRTATKPK
jgi:hypothetical protein